MGTRLGRGFGVAVTIVALLLGLWLRHEVARMDARFFHASWPGVRGLALYLIGDYGGAARAYRAHLRQRYTEQATTGDPVRDAVLRGDLAAAEQGALAALRANPHDVAARLALAEVALGRGDHAAAVRETARVLAGWPDHFEALLLRSVALARSGDHGGAIEALHAGLATGRVRAGFTSFLQALEVAGDLARAPKPVRPLSLLAQYHRYLRMFDPANGRVAVRYAEQAIAAGDRPADAYLAIGIVYYFQGRSERALEALRRAAEVDPRHGEALRWQSVLYGERGDLVNEHRTVRAAFDAAPREPRNIERLAWVALDKLGDPHEAIEASRAALKIRPENAMAHAWLGRGYSMLGERERALVAFERAAALQPTAEFLEQAASTLTSLGRVPEAIAVYQRALVLDPSHPGSRRHLADAYRRLGRYHDAIREYELAYQLVSPTADDLLVLCMLYHETERHPRAAECFRAVLRLEPGNPHAHRMLPHALTGAVRKGSP